MIGLGEGFINQVKKLILLAMRLCLFYILYVLKNDIYLIENVLPKDAFIQEVNAVYLGVHNSRY